MLYLKRSDAGDPVLSDRLNEASTRISTVGRAYERLAYNATMRVSVLPPICGKSLETWRPQLLPAKFNWKARGNSVRGDRAILVALIINELVLNAGKHAYPNSAGGSIWVRVVAKGRDRVQISVRDEGVGLPAGFDPSTSKRLGSRLINALAKQLGPS
jgi:two-component sensor histidine kinase